MSPGATAGAPSQDPTRPTAVAATAELPASGATPAPSSSAWVGARPDAGVAAPYAPDPSGFGDACAADVDCDWLDPCAPARCVATARRPSAAGCDGEMAPPATCRCWNQHCVLEPAKPPAPPAEACDTWTCGLDEGMGACRVGAMEQANRGMLREGPMCSCDERSRRCTFRWVKRVACKTDRDCWVEGFARPHPVRRPPGLTRAFKPCEDGEILPACLDGFCDFGAAYGC